jgi:formylglycine-generating enzyme required for sulfatase activity
MSSSKDYYAVLGVAESAEDVVIRAAYKVLAQKYHPDKNAHAAQSSTVAMAEITEAYRVLGDPIRRKEYDEFRKWARGQQQSDAHQSTQKREQSSSRKASSRRFPVPDIANWSVEQVQQLQARIARELGVTPIFQDQSFATKRQGGFFGAKTETEMVSCPQMVVIPCGRVTRGLEVSEPFALGRFVVSNEEFLAFCRATGRKKPKESRKKKRPVQNINWFDAADYCEWLSSATGARYRLPATHEWEYACRAGTTGANYFGRVPSPKEVNYGFVYRLETSQNEQECRKNWAKPRFPKSQYATWIVNVDCYAPNPWGLFQMLGNVIEYVCDTLPDGTLTAGAHDSCLYSTEEELRADNFSESWEPARGHSRETLCTSFRIARSF